MTECRKIDITEPDKTDIHGPAITVLVTILHRKIVVSVILSSCQLYSCRKSNLKKVFFRYQDFKGKLERLSCDVIPFMHEKLSSNKKILIEGANALFLDIDFGMFDQFGRITLI